MRVMRGIALRRAIALAGLPDDVIVGDPSGFHMRAVEKDPNSALMKSRFFSFASGLWRG